MLPSCFGTSRCPSHGVSLPTVRGICKNGFHAINQHLSPETCCFKWKNHIFYASLLGFSCWFQELHIVHRCDCIVNDLYCDCLFHTRIEFNMITYVWNIGVTWAPSSYAWCLKINHYMDNWQTTLLLLEQLASSWGHQFFQQTNICKH